MAHRITLIEQDALTALRTVSGPFDLVFIDAAKEQYKQYYDLLVPHIRKGALIVAHNAVRQAAGMKDYLDFVKSAPDLDTVILQTGDDGVALSYKK